MARLSILPQNLTAEAARRRGVHPDDVARLEERERKEAALVESGARDLLRQTTAGSWCLPALRAELRAAVRSGAVKRGEELDGALRQASSALRRGDEHKAKDSLVRLLLRNAPEVLGC